VLLIDELDRADEAFEAYLLEILSDWQITIPEFGTVAATTPPVVIVTSNRTREIHDALKRRCFYHWVDYPSLDDELDILKRKAPEAGPELSQQVLRFVHRLREMKLFKAPGVAETIDWAHALVELDCLAVDPATADTTLGVLLKYQDDISKIRGTEAARILAQVQTEILG
jgi:MoxR-like ATPase